MHGEVKTYLSHDVGLWSFEIEVLQRGSDGVVLDVLDRMADLAETNVKQAVDYACEKLETSKQHHEHIREVLGRARYTREKRSRLRFFVRSAAWAARNGLTFEDLADVSTTEWRVATAAPPRANPFVMVPHLMNLSPRPPQPLAVCAELLPNKKGLDFRTARYACALIVLLRRRERLQAPQHEAAALAMEAGFRWTTDFADPFDLSLGELPRLRPSMSYADETKWFRSLSIPETEDVMRADAPMGFEYRYWMRDERLRLSHQIVIHDDQLAFAANVEARTEVWRRLTHLRAFRFESGADADGAEAGAEAGAATTARNALGPIHIFGNGAVVEDDDDDGDGDDDE